MLHIQNIIPTFALFKPKNSFIDDVLSIFLCSFVSVYLQRYKAIKSHLCTHTRYDCSSLARTGGDSLSCFIYNLISFKKNAKEQRNLPASEAQYLARNARRSEIRFKRPGRNRYVIRVKSHGRTFRAAGATPYNAVRNFTAAFTRTALAEA